jgi:Protein of unknown function with PCYCGC motif
MKYRVGWLIVLAVFVGDAAFASFLALPDPEQSLGTMNQPPYHTEPSREPLPLTLDPQQFLPDRRAYVAYTLASRIEGFLYQVPCYCPCKRMEGHESLLDCFVGKHGIKCSICQREVLFCYQENAKKKPPAEARKDIARGKAWKLNLNKEIEHFYRRLVETKQERPGDDRRS